MKRSNPENNLHRSVALLLARVLRKPTIWTTIGHGGGGRVRGAQLKAKGVKKGWPDIIVLHPGIGLYGTRVVGLELKALNGRKSPEQVEMDGAFNAVDAQYWICRCQEDVLSALAKAEIPYYGRIS